MPGLPLQTDMTFGAKWGFVYGEYRPRFFFWESVVMLRKLLMVVVIVYVGYVGEGVQVRARGRERGRASLGGETAELERDRARACWASTGAEISSCLVFQRTRAVPFWT